MAAVAERVILALVVYAWLLRSFSAGAAFLGSFAGTIVFCSDNADALSLHHHDSVLWAAAAALLASTGIARQMRPGWFVLSGVFASLCFFTKQTTGLGVSLVIPLMVVWHRKRIFASLAGFGAGWMIPAGLILQWLARNGALGAFAEQVFTKGPTSKGPLWMVLLRPLLMCIQDPGYGLSLLVALCLLGLAWGPLSRLGRPGPAPRTGGSGLLFAALCSAAMLVGIAWGIAGSHAAAAGLIVSNILVLATLAGCAILFLVQCASPADIQIRLMTGVSAAVAFMLSLSWVAYGPMAMPGLALLIAAIAGDTWRSRRLRPKIVVSVVLTAAMGVLIAARFEQPFWWAGWREPAVREATTPPRIPELKGFRLAPEVNSSIETVTAAIVAHSGPADPVLVFPYGPLFYTFAHRKPATFSIVQWFDVTPDYIAHRDAEEIRAHPPKVIVYFRFTPDEIEAQESIFRAHKNSGQRDLISAIDQLVGHYTLVENLTTPMEGRPLQVFARP